MRILTRYIVFELLKVFLLALTSMTALVFVLLLAKEAVDNGFGLVPILRLLPYILPQALQYAVPGSLLLATAVVYGRVAASNEVVAVKSMGISPMVLVWPLLVFATLASLSAVVLNDVAVSWGRGGVEQVAIQSLEEIVYGRLRTVRNYSNSRLKVAVERVDGERLINPVITYFAREGKPPWMITADEASIDVDIRGGMVNITCVNADGSNGDDRSLWIPGDRVIPLTLQQFRGGERSSRSPSTYALREIGPSKRTTVAHIEQLQQEMTAEAAHALMTGRTFELAEQVWSKRQGRLRSSVATLHRLDTEPHRRWANGFSCLGFVLIGAPTSILLRRGEVWGSFFVCFLPILLLYYPMLAGSVNLAKSGTIAPQAVWLGNIVLAAIGIWLLRRVIRF